MGKETVDAVKEMGRNAIAFQLDATNVEQVKEVVGQVVQALGSHIDILMNSDQDRKPRDCMIWSFINTMRKEGKMSASGSDVASLLKVL